mgnify:CR=1 FL=1
MTNGASPYFIWIKKFKLFFVDTAEVFTKSGGVESVIKRGLKSCEVISDKSQEIKVVFPASLRFFAKTFKDHRQHSQKFFCLPLNS